MHVLCTANNNIHNNGYFNTVKYLYSGKPVPGVKPAVGTKMVAGSSPAVKPAGQGSVPSSTLTTKTETLEKSRPDISKEEKKEDGRDGNL
jgi:hypothetical protein